MWFPPITSPEPEVAILKTGGGFVGLNINSNCSLLLYSGSSVLKVSVKNP